MKSDKIKIRLESTSEDQIHHLVSMLENLEEMGRLEILSRSTRTPSGEIKNEFGTFRRISNQKLEILVNITESSLK